MFKDLIETLPRPLRALAIRLDRSPIDSVDGLAEFVRTRSLYIGQTSLYGYLKTRMGTRYREHFQDDIFAESIRISAVKVFGSCLGDLSIFAAATVHTGASDAGSAERTGALAMHLFSNGIDIGLTDADRVHLPDELAEAFAQRTTETLWPNAAIAGNAFTGSSGDLIRYAPVVDEFKALDEEIVTNSIRFKWRDVREQLTKRIDSHAIMTDWLVRSTD